MGISNKKNKKIKIQHFTLNKVIYLLCNYVPIKFIKHLYIFFKIHLPKYFIMISLTFYNLALFFLMFMS